VTRSKRMSYNQQDDDDDGGGGDVVVEKEFYSHAWFIDVGKPVRYYIIDYLNGGKKIYLD